MVMVIVCYPQGKQLTVVPSHLRLVCVWSFHATHIFKTFTIWISKSKPTKLKIRNRIGFFNSYQATDDGHPNEGHSRKSLDAMCRLHQLVSLISPRTCNTRWIYREWWMLWRGHLIFGRRSFSLLGFHQHHFFYVCPPRSPCLVRVSWLYVCLCNG